MNPQMLVQIFCCHMFFLVYLHLVFVLLHVLVG
jgi:hypothetical protein